MLLRRDVLKALGLLGASAPLAYNSTLQAMARVAAGQQHATDYKALVCIMLNGGNDAFNMVFPAPEHPEYKNYLKSRQALAVPNYVTQEQYPANQGDKRYSSRLLPISLTTPEGNDTPLMLHPGMEGLQQLTEQGQVAVIANTGVLIEPGSRTEFKTNKKRKPAFLFAHNQQRKAVYSGIGDNTKQTGWGGDVSELATLSKHNRGTVLPMGISFHGSNQWLRGKQTQGAVLGAGKPGRILGIGPQGNAKQQARTKAAQELQSLPSDDMLLRLMRGKLTSAQDLSAALTHLWTTYAKELAALDAFFDDSKLAKQLAAVVKTIFLRDSLGMRRQVFMVELGGFDTHAGQVDKHPLLLSELSNAISSFQRALDSLALTEHVTTFTASDFGRTLASNGNGTDHGWGSHQLVVGGAVKGGLYGQWPSMLVGGADDYRSGRLLPTTSLTQANASLAAWFGASATDITALFPNLGNFTAGALPLFEREGYTS